MNTQFAQLGYCYSPQRGEGLVLRPEFWGQHDDSRAPFVNGDQV